MRRGLQGHDVANAGTGLAVAVVALFLALVMPAPAQAAWHVSQDGTSVAIGRDDWATLQQNPSQVVEESLYFGYDPDFGFAGDPPPYDPASYTFYHAWVLLSSWGINSGNWQYWGGWLPYPGETPGTVTLSITPQTQYLLRLVTAETSDWYALAVVPGGSNTTVTITETVTVNTTSTIEGTHTVVDVASWPELGISRFPTAPLSVDVSSFPTAPLSIAGTVSAVPTSVTDALGPLADLQLTPGGLRMVASLILMLGGGLVKRFFLV